MGNIDEQTRDEGIRSAAKEAAEEIINYYNSEPIDEHDCNQRMVNAILKWLEENRKTSIKSKDDEITEGE